jgi:FixJ family two-component response regulator
MTSRGSTIYIVDDDVSVCRSLALLLEPHGFRVETFTRAQDFLAFRHRKAPSCLVLDVRLPDINGIDLQKAMTVRKLSIPIIFITGHGDIPMSVKAMKAGAIDFLPKPFTEKELLTAITLAIAKNKTEKREQTEIRKIQQRIKTLTPREQEVFRLVAKGMLSKQIALKLGTTLQTIKVHRSRVMQKMHARSVTELVHFAQKCGITSFQG